MEFIQSAQGARRKAQNNEKYNSKQPLKQRAFFFSVSIIKFGSELPYTTIYKIILSQLVRSATSIGANVIEAQAGSSRRDFIKYFEIALKSANEARYWLEILRDATDADKRKVEALLQEAIVLSNRLGVSLLTLKNKRTL